MMLRKLGVALLLLTCVAGLTVVVLLPAPLERDPPRDLPWQLPDFRAAQTSWSIDENGKINTEVEHFFLHGISPKMVAWFYQQLPISTVELNGRTLPLYHIFHPTEHGTIRILSAAPGGAPGMAKGAVVERMEWFGEYDSQGRAEIVEFSERGMLAVPTFLGLSIGEVRHTFRASEGGTAYHVSSVIGSDLPLLGGVINYFLRNYQFHPQMLEQWRRHQVEEVASLQFFLPQIYAQRENGNHYAIN